LQMERTKKEKKDKIKLIEYYLRHYTTFKVANDNLQRQLQYLTPDENQSHLSMNSDEKEKIIIIRKKLNETLLIENSIVNAISNLDMIEQKFINLRYFRNYSIEKTAQTIGYSKASLYVLRSRIMDKLLISFGGMISSSTHDNQ
jgi:DNA-directed RNA polymerase specialized sigma subunit